MFAKKVWVFVVLTLLFGSSLFVTAETPEIGQKATEFSLSTPEGHPMSLSEFTSKGTVVLVVLRGFPGYQCPYCQRQVQHFLMNPDKFAVLCTQAFVIYPAPPSDPLDPAK